MASFRPDFHDPPEGRQVRIALCQMLVGPDKQLNMNRASSFVREAAGAGAQLVVLPEMWNCPYSNDSFPEYAEDVDGGPSPSAETMSRLAREHKVTLVGGSIPERSQGRLYNTCLVYGPDGALLAKHRKVHLFDIDIPGEITFKESETLTGGDKGTVVDTPVGRIGVGICYDIRFPELAMLYARQGCQMIIYPGAFNMTTGPLHWELLQRARAVDNQVFVMTCSPARKNGASYVAWGHSTVVSPYGVVMANLDEMEAVLMCDINTEEVHARRRNMPLMSQRRWDLYKLEAKRGTFDAKESKGASQLTSIIDGMTGRALTGTARKAEDKVTGT